VQEEDPDVVLLDMMLPGRSGFLVLEKIKGYEDAPIVIMLTANEGRRHQMYAESLGVDGYLVKPVPLDRLITTCLDLLAKQDAEDGPEA
jgi:DNA-binding response OmpR family regulator